MRSHLCGGKVLLRVSTVGVRSRCQPRASNVNGRLMGPVFPESGSQVSPPGQLRFVMRAARIGSAWLMSARAM